MVPDFPIAIRSLSVASCDHLRCPYSGVPLHLVSEPYVSPARQRSPPLVPPTPTRHPQSSPRPQSPPVDPLYPSPASRRERPLDILELPSSSLACLHFPAFRFHAAVVPVTPPSPLPPFCSPQPRLVRHLLALPFAIPQRLHMRPHFSPGPPPPQPPRTYDVHFGNPMRMSCEPVPPSQCHSYHRAG